MRVLYVAAWIRFSPNWQGHGSGVNKMLYVWGGTAPFVYTMAHGAGGEPLRPVITLQGLAAPYTNGQGATANTVNLAQNVGAPVTIPRGAWVRYEYVFTLNTAGAATGSVDAWVNGTPTHHFTGVTFTAAGGTWSLVKWAPVWGGIGGTVTSAMSQQIDHLYVSGK